MMPVLRGPVILGVFFLLFPSYKFLEVQKKLEIVVERNVTRFITENHPDVNAVVSAARIPWMIPDC